MRAVVDAVRAGRVPAGEDRACQVIARHRDPDGQLLDRATAGVELLNIVRPTVAVARYVVFAALALHRDPDRAERLYSGDAADIEAFVQEVRRFYPFFPAVGGRVRHEFEWRGHRFRRGQWVLLDLHGTDHDPQAWHRPEQFEPERFRSTDPGAFALVAQGAGDHSTGHRCPGEWVTIELTKVAVQALTRWMSYTVPQQDLRVPLSRIPAAPNSGFIIDRVRPRSG